MSLNSLYFRPLPATCANKIDVLLCKCHLGYLYGKALLAQNLRDLVIADVFAFERIVSPGVSTTDVSFRLYEIAEALFLLVGRSR